MKQKIGIGVIGTGFARKVQIPAFLACQKVQILSIASGSIENARATAEEFDIKHFTDDWHETVSHADVDLVCITTPPNLHCEMTLASIENGKHVLCEKPMAMNVAEAEEMTLAAAKKPILALIDHELRFQPGRQLAFEMLRDGRIGKIKHAKYIFQAPHRGDPNIPWNWWSDASVGGGALGAIGSHVIDSSNWFLGTDIRSVFCQLQTHIKERSDSTGAKRAVTSDDESNMLLRFKDGELTEDATGLVSVSMTETPKYKNQIEFYGDKGAIYLNSHDELFVANTGENDWTQIGTVPGKLLPGYPNTGFSQGFMEFAPLIVDAIRDGRKHIEHAATFEDGLSVQKVLDAAHESNRSGQAILL